MVYIIGSVSQEDEIKQIAEYFKKNEGFSVIYVKSQPDKSIESLIFDCYKNISESDLVVAVPKKNGTFGIGVTYEIMFAKFIGKEVMKVSIEDIKNPKWIQKRRSFY